MEINIMNKKDTNIWDNITIINSIPAFSTLSISGTHTVGQCDQNATLIATPGGWNDNDINDLEDYYYPPPLISLS